MRPALVVIAVLMAATAVKSQAPTPNSQITDECELRAPGCQLVTRDAYLMGTSVQLAAYAPTRQAGLATLERALHALEDTERELSTWRDDSAISALNRHPIGIAWQAPRRT